jgi:hypothetical protein
MEQVGDDVPWRTQALYIVLKRGQYVHFIF